jgi:twinfilin-like protein
MKALGAGNFKHDWFATQAVSLLPKAIYVRLIN